MSGSPGVIDSKNVRGEWAGAGEMENVREDGVLAECGDEGVGVIYGILLCDEKKQRRGR